MRGTPIAREVQALPNTSLRVTFGVVAVSGWVLDLITKSIAVRQLDPNAPIRLLGGLLTLRLIRNPGAAFSLGGQFTALFAALSLAVLGFVILRLVPRVRHSGWAVALGLLCAGVSGNLTDRIFRSPGFLRGHVVDFFQLPYWPIFNIADMCISAAAVLILVLAVGKNVTLSGERYSR